MNNVIQNKLRVRAVLNVFVAGVLSLASFIVAAETESLVLNQVGSEVSKNAENKLSVEQIILRDIKLSQLQLAEQQEQVAQQKTKLSTQLARLERSIANLKNELTTQQQTTQQYESQLERDKNTIEKQARQISLMHARANALLGNETISLIDAANNGNEQAVAKTLSRLSNLLLAVNEKLTPHFKDQPVADGAGRLQVAKVLSFGPEHYFINENLDTGTVKFASGVFQQATIFSRQQQLALIQLSEAGHSNLLFDPTLGQLQALRDSAEGVVEHVQKGGAWAMPIISFAALALLVALLKMVQLFRLPAVKIIPANKFAAFHENQSVLKAAMGELQRNLLAAALSESNKKSRDDKLFMLLDQYKYRLEKWISIIAITAAIAPLLGLLGTVSGMIETFKMMTLFGAGDPSVVSGGIAQALITTELGLLVAIPALVLHAVLSRKANRYYQELENFALLLGQVDVPATSHLPMQDAQNKAVG